MKKLNENQIQALQGGILVCIALPEEAGILVCLPFICPGPPGTVCPL